MSGRRYQLIIFDWDGTLIDSIAGIVDCTVAACAAIGVDPPPYETVRAAIGLGLDESMRRFFPEREVDARRLGEAYRRLWVERYHAVSEPFPATADLLRDLREQDYLLAVATAKSRRGLSADFERTGLGVFFHASRTADESVSKPHPAMLDELLEELGVGAEEALMVGDTPHDLAMAENAGVPAVGVHGGAAPAAALEGYGALAVLAGVEELAEWLDGSSATGEVAASS
ncbi:MAG: HAD-IA family hydrolase [Thermoanaerobaculia bacterium]|nr:HAD-IA family hydrolase [Thermoanaerobaculia bacterium]